MLQSQRREGREGWGHRSEAEPGKDRAERGASGASGEAGGQRRDSDASQRVGASHDKGEREGKRASRTSGEGGTASDLSRRMEIASFMNMLRSGVSGSSAGSQARDSSQRSQTMQHAEGKTPQRSGGEDGVEMSREGGESRGSSGIVGGEERHASQGLKRSRDSEKGGEAGEGIAGRSGGVERGMEERGEDTGEAGMSRREGGKALVMDPSRARKFLEALCSRCGIDSQGYLDKLSRGESFMVRGVALQRVGSYYIAYPSMPEASHVFEEVSKVVSKGLGRGGFSFTTSYVDLDEVLKALKLSGMSFEEAINKPIEAAAKAIYTVNRIDPVSGVGKASKILNFMSNIIADRIARENRGEVEKIERILRITKSGIFYSRESSYKPIGRLNLIKTVERTELYDDKPVWDLYTEGSTRIYIVIDKSGSMDIQFGGFKNIAYASGIAQLISMMNEARYDVITFDTDVHHIGENLDRESLIPILARRMEAGGGTSYASALDYVAKIAEHGSVVVVVGDFIDNILPDRETISILHSKDIKTLLAPTPRADRTYLEWLAKTLNAEIIKPHEEIF
jgi:hypothetical protein